jgi:prevent-host-death family protein
MKPSKDIKPVTFMKSHAAELIRSVTRRKSPVVITQSGEAKVVVQDIESYERDRRTLLMLKLLSQGVVEAERGEDTDQDIFFSRLEKFMQET